MFTIEAIPPMLVYSITWLLLLSGVFGEVPTLGSSQPQAIAKFVKTIDRLAPQGIRKPLVTISVLLSSPADYHKKTVSVRGTVTQPELHLDKTRLFINFVFLLKDGSDTLIVFGQHDRTQGQLSIATDQMVEVTGMFWKDRVAQDYHFQNNLEAFRISVFPPLTPQAM